MERLVVRFAEIGLKGKNRKEFQSLLAKNIKRIFGRNTGQKVLVKNSHSRIYVDTDLPRGAIKENMKKVFGVSSYSHSYETELNMEAIKSKLGDELSKIENLGQKKIAVSVNRIQKVLDESPKIEAEVGSFVCENFGSSVDLKNPDLEIYIEVSKKISIYFEKVECSGGLPVDCEGRVILLINSKESLEAGLLAMKRGCGIFPVVLEDGFSLEEAEEIVSELQKYSANPLHLNVLKEEEVRNFAEERDCKAVVVSDNLSNLKDYEFTVLRPRLLV